MSDAELIRRVAEFWIDCGGDAEGVEWCWMKLRDEVARQKDAERETRA